MKEKTARGEATDGPNEVGASLSAIIFSFNTRIADLQDLVIARNMYPATSIPNLTAVDATIAAMESQIKAIKDKLQEERAVMPKVKKMVDMALRQQKKMEHLLSHVPAEFSESRGVNVQNLSSSLPDEPGISYAYEEPVVLPKEKKVRTSAPRWYVTSDELDSLSSYMRGRLTLDKINIAVNEIATHADSNFQFITAKKVPEESWKKAMELRDIAMTESVKGKHFFLESDLKGPGLKLDNTGKAILTVLRHLGRFQETRIGHHRVMMLMKP